MKEIIEVIEKHNKKYVKILASEFDEEKHEKVQLLIEEPVEVSVVIEEKPKRGRRKKKEPVTE